MAAGRPQRTPEEEAQEMLAYWEKVSREGIELTIRRLRECADEIERDLKRLGEPGPMSDLSDYHTLPEIGARTVSTVSQMFGNLRLNHLVSSAAGIRQQEGELRRLRQ